MERKTYRPKMKAYGKRYQKKTKRQGDFLLYIKQNLVKIISKLEKKIRKIKSHILRQKRWGLTITRTPLKKFLFSTVVKPVPFWYDF